MQAGRFGIFTPDPKKLTEPWTSRAILPERILSTCYHGLGDLDGDGKTDIHPLSAAGIAAF